MPLASLPPCPVDLCKVELWPGQTLTLREIDWPEFERIILGLGDRAAARIAYSNARLELRMPLPEHEKIKRFIVIAIEIVLDALALDWEPYGSTTFKNQDRQVGIEPDDCFYVQHAAQMLGLRRLDLTVDPPPDLAIEVDITSPTRLLAYERLGVPELWRYRESKVEIWQFQGGQYVQCDQSLVMPNVPVLAGVNEFLPRLQSESVSRLKREFRDWVETQLSTHNSIASSNAQ